MLERWIGYRSQTGLFVLRLALSVIFFAHGGQKLFGFFGGEGMQATIEQFAEFGIIMPGLMARLVGGIEFIGGILFFLGFFTRETAFAVILIMLGAIYTVHGPNGFFILNNGFEYNFMIIAACICLFLGGGGSGSLDSFVFPRERWTFISDPSKVKLLPPEE